MPASSRWTMLRSSRARIAADEQEDKDTEEQSNVAEEHRRADTEERQEQEKGSNVESDKADEVV